MAEQGAWMPGSSSEGRRRWVAAVVIAAAALVGAGLVLGVWHRPESGQTQVLPSSSLSSVAASRSDAVSACLGGADPAAAVVAAMQAAGTPDGAAQAAAATVRFTESVAFAQPGARQVIQRIADDAGSAQLVALQSGQAPYLAQLTSAVAHPGRGAYLASAEPLDPTVTVLTPVDWATRSAAHHTWRFVTVRLSRLDGRWAVVAADDDAAGITDDVLALRGADVHPGDLDRYAAALSSGGWRRYSGDC